LEVLEKVCSTLNCDLGDIASFKSSNEQKGWYEYG
jgi:DNA-binding Xre family transcriptional regulator